MAYLKLEPGEVKATRIFRGKHKHKREQHSPSTEYIATETGIGLQLCIRCQVCGLTKDITDYSAW